MQVVTDIRNLGYSSEKGSRQLWAELFFSVSLLVFLTVILESLSIDMRVADYFYQIEGHHWLLKKAWITSIVIHKGGKYLSIVILLAVIGLYISTYRVASLRFWRKPLVFVLTASLLSVLVVALVKELSFVSCPWEFSRYGGKLDYVPLIEQLFIRNGDQCFPAGHASSGYAWISLYFAGRYLNARWRWWALGFSLLIGVIFGLAQQLRGAHFFSHDLWSLGICWIVALVCYYLMLKPYDSGRHHAN